MRRRWYRQMARAAAAAAGAGWQAEDQFSKCPLGTLANLKWPSAMRNLAPLATCHCDRCTGGSASNHTNIAAAGCCVGGPSYAQAPAAAGLVARSASSAGALACCQIGLATADCTLHMGGVGRQVALVDAQRSNAPSATSAIRLTHRLAAAAGKAVACCACRAGAAVGC